MYEPSTTEIGKPTTIAVTYINRLGNHQVILVRVKPGDDLTEIIDVLEEAGCKHINTTTGPTWTYRQFLAALE